MELDNKKDLEFYDILKSLHGKCCDLYLIFGCIVVVMRLKPDVDASTNYIDVYGALRCPIKLK